MSDPGPRPAVVSLDLLERIRALASELESLVEQQDRRATFIPYGDRYRSEQAEGWYRVLLEAQQALENVSESVAFNAYSEELPPGSVHIHRGRPVKP